MKMGKLGNPCKMDWMVVRGWIDGGNSVAMVVGGSYGLGAVFFVLLDHLQNSAAFSFRF